MVKSRPVPTREGPHGRWELSPQDHAGLRRDAEIHP